MHQEHVAAKQDSLERVGGLDLSELLANPTWIASAVQNAPHLDLITFDSIINGIGKTTAQHPKVTEILPMDASIEV
jgi:hypothetical protein